MLWIRCGARCIGYIPDNCTVAVHTVADTAVAVAKMAHRYKDHSLLPAIATVADNLAIDTTFPAFESHGHPWNPS